MCARFLQKPYQIRQAVRDYTGPAHLEWREVLIKAAYPDFLNGCAHKRAFQDQ